MASPASAAAWHTLCSTDELDLENTLTCGQAFRWSYHETQQLWRGVIRTMVVSLRTVPTANTIEYRIENEAPAYAWIQ